MSHQPRPFAKSLEEMRQEKDNAYEERNRLVALLAAVFPSARCKTSIDGWDPEWHGCVFISLPTGQASWHYHDSQAHLFEHVEERMVSWDGHSTPEKYKRIEAACRTRSAMFDAGVRAERERVMKLLDWWWAMEDDSTQKSADRIRAAIADGLTVGELDAKLRLRSVNPAPTPTRIGREEGERRERERCRNIVLAALPDLCTPDLKVARRILRAMYSGKPLDELCDAEGKLKEQP